MRSIAAYEIAAPRENAHSLKGVQESSLSRYASGGNQQNSPAPTAGTRAVIRPSKFARNHIGYLIDNDNVYLVVFPKKNLPEVYES